MTETMHGTSTTRVSSEPPPPSAPSEGVRLAWLIPGGILALAALLWGTFMVVSVLAHEEYTTTTSFSASEVTALDIRSDNGSITVDASPTSDGTVVVTADVSDGWKPTDVAVRVVDGVLELRGGCPWLSQVWCHVDFTVALPADVPVTVDGSNGGVLVRGTTAPLDVDSDNGSITLEDVGGDITVSNDNGSVTGRRLSADNVQATNQNGGVELAFLEAPRSVVVTTDNGGIEVVVPDAGVLYRVELRTDNGSTDNAVRTDPSSDRSIRLTSDNGSVSVRPPG